VLRIERGVQDVDDYQIDARGGRSPRRAAAALGRDRGASQHPLARVELSGVRLAEFESACLDDSARPSPPRKKVYFAAAALRPLTVFAFV
jgi:hypothetical protein